MTALRIQVFWDTTVLWWGNVSRRVEEISIMKRHFVVTRTNHQTEIPALPDSWVTNTTSVKILCPQKNCLSLGYRKNITCPSVGLLKIGQFFFLSCTSVDGWVTTNYYFMSVIARSRSMANKLIADTHSTKFLGLIIGILSRKCHFDQLMSKLSKEYYAIRAAKSFTNEKP